MSGGVAHDVGLASLVRMSNQIASNFVHLPADEAAAAVAKHLHSFWAPSMQADLARHALDGGDGLDDVVLAAVRLL
jgi:formate dehydrogenase subunit delta